MAPSGRISPLAPWRSRHRIAPLPAPPVYHVGVDDGTVVLVAEHDLCGPLLDLVTAVLAMGEAVLARAVGFAGRPACSSGLSRLSHRLAGTAPDSAVRAGHLLDAGLRIRIPAHSPDAPV